MFLEFLGGGSIQDVLTSKGGKGLPLKDARFYFACMVAAFEASTLLNTKTTSHNTEEIPRNKSGAKIT